MKNIGMAALIFSFVMLLGLAGCGKDDGTAVSTYTTPALITLSTQGTPSAAPINSAQVTLTLPEGVTVSADSSGNTASGVVKASGTSTGAVMAQGIYTPATSTAPAKVTVFIISSTGFSAGEFATVTCRIASGASPGSTSYSVSDFAAYKATVDSGTGTVTDAVAITGLTPAYVAD